MHAEADPDRNIVLSGISLEAEINVRFLLTYFSDVSLCVAVSLYFG